MTSIEDPLSKPLWPPVDPGLQDAVLNLLVVPCSRGNSEFLKVGFNSTMEAIERHMAGEGHVETIFVARSDLHPAECLPLALASAAAQIRLFTLPKGSTLSLRGEGVAAICKGSEEPQIQNLVQSVGFAQLEWVYQGAIAAKRKANVKCKPGMEVSPQKP